MISSHQAFLIRSGQKRQQPAKRATAPIASQANQPAQMNNLQGNRTSGKSNHHSNTNTNTSNQTNRAEMNARMAAMTLQNDDAQHKQQVEFIFSELFSIIC